MGQICEICVHFQQKVKKFAYRGTFVRRIQKLPDPRGLSNGSAAILNFRNGHHDGRLEVNKTASSSLTSMKFGIEGYFVVLSSKITGSQMFDQWISHHLAFSKWPPR